MFIVSTAARAQGTLKIGTVDMNRTFREYNKTKDAEAKINDAKNQAKKEYDERADAYKKALDDINNLNKQLEAPAATAVRTARRAKVPPDTMSYSTQKGFDLTGARKIRSAQRQERALLMCEGTA